MGPIFYFREGLIAIEKSGFNKKGQLINYTGGSLVLGAGVKLAQVLTPTGGAHVVMESQPIFQTKVLLKIKNNIGGNSLKKGFVIKLFYCNYIAT